MVSRNKNNLLIMVYPFHFEYINSVNTTIGSTPFYFVHKIEVVLLRKIEITPLKLFIEILPNTTQLEENLFYLEKLHEHIRDSNTTNNVHKRCIKLRTQICGTAHKSQDRSYNFTHKLKKETMQKWLATMNAFINQK